MSQENVELHRRAVAAFNARDVDGFAALCDPGIELRSAVTGSVYTGHDGVRKWHVDLSEAFGDEVWMEPSAYFALGEYTITFHLLHGRGQHSGAAVAEPFAHIHRWRDELTIHFRAYADQQAAFTDFGVPQGAWERFDP
jgi:ketosteroid isomerase-like protein